MSDMIERTELGRVVDRLLADREIVAGKRIRPMRRADLARKMGMPWTGLARILSARNPSTDSIRKLAHALDITGAHLMHLIEEATPGAMTPQ